MTFHEWFDAMETRYDASYGSYKELLEEAFDAGVKSEKDRTLSLPDGSEHSKFTKADF